MTEISDESLKSIGDYLDVEQKTETAATPVDSADPPFQHISQQQKSGIIRIAGCISSIDQWGRLHFTTPKSRWGRDTLNTSVILASLDTKLRKGSSPVKWNGFISRATAKTVYIVGGKSVDVKKAAGIPLELTLSYTEFEFETKVGWSLTLISAKSITT